MNISSIVDQVDNFYKEDRIKIPDEKNLGNTLDEKNEPTPEEMQQFVQKLNKESASSDERISFSYNEKLNRIILKVINSNTDEIVREIPAKDMVSLMEHLKDSLGILFDKSI